MMMWYGGNSGWAGWLLMTIAMVLFWALIITAVVLIVRYLVSQRPAGAGAGSVRTPEEVLAERYARGEIDDEEYERRLALLHENR